MLKVWGRCSSFNVQKVLWLVGELGLPHEHIPAGGSFGGLDALAPYLGPSQTVALLGSSGVGKSTIINRLLGREALKTAAISDAVGKGRHTTTSRQLVELPGGALLIDTPGMRELQPWADAAARARSAIEDAAIEPIPAAASR